MSVGKRKQPADVFLTIRLTPEMHEELRRLAKKNERSTSGEARFALGGHLKQETEEREGTAA